MVYPKIKDYYDFIFNYIRNLVYDDIRKPIYENDTRGIKQLNGLLERIQNDTYYPDFYKKAAYFFIALSTSHYFENGNKRIAMFSYVYFSQINHFQFRSIQKRKYINWFKTYFPNYKLDMQTFRSNIGWALYNLNRAINIKLASNKEGHNYNFDELKKISEHFIRFASRKKFNKNHR